MAGCAKGLSVLRLVGSSLTSADTSFLSVHSQDSSILMGLCGPSLLPPHSPYPFRDGKSADSFSAELSFCLYQVLSMVWLPFLPLDSQQPANLSWVR